MAIHFECEHAVANAEVMLDVCRQEYASAGRHDAVKALWGCDVQSAAAAHVALLTVKELASTPDTDDVRRYTVAALEAAHKELTQQTQLLAG